MTRTALTDLPQVQQAFKIDLGRNNDYIPPQHAKERKKKENLFYLFYMKTYKFCKEIQIEA